jgi:hypothetical protein
MLRCCLDSLAIWVQVLEQSIMKKTTHLDFNGKLIQVYIAGDKHSYTMNCPRLEIQAGRAFLVGTVPHSASNGDWCEGAVSAIAWDQVTTYMLFDSPKHYDKCLAKFEKYKRQS